jgi:predicted transcriptional regulator
MAEDQSQLTRQAEALLERAGLAQASTSTPIKRDQPRLTRTEIALAWNLHQEGLTQAAIGQRLGVSQVAISQLLRKFHDTSDIGKQLAKAESFNSVRRLVRFSKTRDKVGLEAGKTLLQVAGLTEKQQQTNVAVQVIVGQPLAGTPGHEPVINAEAKVVDHNPHNPGASDEVVE